MLLLKRAQTEFIGLLFFTWSIGLAVMTVDYVRSRQIYDYTKDLHETLLLKQLRVGDVILTTDPTAVLRPIVSFQNKFVEFPPASRKFTHVGLYVGVGKVVHSMPYLGGHTLLAGGVEKTDLRDLLSEGTQFTVLRMKNGLTNDLKNELVRAAENHIGHPYDYSFIFESIATYTLKISPGKIRKLKELAERTANIFVPAKPPSAVDFAKAFVCSDFVFAVFDELFQQKNPCNYEGGNPTSVVMPCAFYANPNFADVVLQLSETSLPTLQKPSPRPTASE